MTQTATCARAQILELRDSINTMVDQLDVFAAEGIRVSRVVEPEGKLGSQAEASPSANVSSLKRSRAVVLDDNRDAADTLALALEIFGLEVRALYEPHDAVELVSAFDPDLVFLDIGMPGLSGYDLARTLQEVATRPRVIVAVTGWGQPEHRRRTAEAGFDHHLVKPPELDVIRQICASVTAPAPGPR